jgi:hypothetical protein
MVVVVSTSGGTVVVASVGDVDESDEATPDGSFDEQDNKSEPIAARATERKILREVMVVHYNCQ